MTHTLNNSMAGERVSGHLIFHQTGECKSFINPVQYYSP